MKRGAFLNSRKANCSIYESGLMVYEAIKSSEHYELDYFETDPKLTEYNKYKNPPYDFHIINWHPYTLAIPKDSLTKLPARIAIVVEVASAHRDFNPFTPLVFDAYAVIDPTKDRYDNYFPLPRPIIRFPTKPLLDESKIVLGSFGLYSESFKNEKRFGEIVEAANNSGRECIVRINLPLPNYTNTSIETIKKYGDWLKSLATPNVDVRITHDYMDMEQLAAVADQAIAAGRAIMTTNCSTFRHLHKYIPHYPEQSYLELAESTVPGVLQMREEWSPENFKKSFNDMLRERKIA
jgi:arsenate reductase-like glutaredoxin family protein